MSAKTSQEFSFKATCLGVVIGALMSILFVVLGSPGLIGVGAAIGTSIGIAVNECEKREDEKPLASCRKIRGRGERG